MQEYAKISFKICQRAWLLGGRSPPDPLPGLRPWTPLGDFRPPDPLSFSSPLILNLVPLTFIETTSLIMLFSLKDYYKWSDGDRHFFNRRSKVGQNQIIILSSRLGPVRAWAEIPGVSGGSRPPHFFGRRGRICFWSLHFTDKSNSHKLALIMKSNIYGGKSLTHLS